MTSATLFGERNLDELVTDAQAILAKAIAEYEPAAVIGCVSGGKDSVTLLDVCRDQLTHVGMANTTIGCEATRDFVRQRAHDLWLPLIEAFPPATYEEIVLEHGFPGAGHFAHNLSYTRLKQRAFRVMQRELCPPGETYERARWLELEDIRRADPELVDYIEELQHKADEAGIPSPYNRCVEGGDVGPEDFTTAFPCLLDVLERSNLYGDHDEGGNMETVQHWVSKRRHA